MQARPLSGKVAILRNVSHLRDLLPRPFFKGRERFFVVGSTLFIYEAKAQHVFSILFCLIRIYVEDLAVH